MRKNKVEYRLIFLFILAIFLFQNAYTQRWGVRTGANLATIRTDEQSIDYNGKFAFFLGILAELEVADRLYIQPELSFSQQGANYYTPTCFFCFSGPSGKVRLNYLNIPVMAKLKLSDAFYIEAGPQAGILLSAKWKEDGETREDISDEIRSTDFGAGLGVGFEFDSGLFLGARYTYGFSNISEVENTNIHNSVLSMSIGWMF